MHPLRFMIFSYDSESISHTARSIKIAESIARNFSDASILILTDLSIIGRFAMPDNVDYVHLPSMVYGHETEAGSKYLNIDSSITLKIRCKIANSAVKTFKPDMVIVDRDPLAMPKEMDTVLSFIKSKFPRTKIAWALQDILGDPKKITEGIRKLQLLQMLDRFCDEVWVLGQKDIFDQCKAYEFSGPFTKKLKYVHYLGTQEDHSDHEEAPEPDGNQHRVLVTAGSGLGGFPLIDSYFLFLEKAGEKLGLESVIITGPMMPSQKRNMLKKRSRSLSNVSFHQFSKNFQRHVRNSDLVISTGGYNTLCEILSYQKHAIFAPEALPTNGHLARGQVFEQLGLVRLLNPESLDSDILGNEIHRFFAGEQKPETEQRSANIALDGLENILDRIKLHTQDAAAQ